MSFLPEEFEQFIAPQTNRCDFIQNWLLVHGVESAVALIDGHRHIIIQFAREAYNPMFSIKTVIAHYDRVEGSPGANDNSAAVFMLMNWAVELSRKVSFHNVRIILTDGEELGWNTGVSEQGAFGIASTFKKLGIANDVFVFDSCGRGEVPVLAKTVIPFGAASSFAKKFNALYDKTQNILRRASPSRWMCLPVPYSDNASFLACGIPAVAITMLPADEASLYARELLTNKNLENEVMNREVSKAERSKSDYHEYSYKERLPLTWKLFHTEKDNIASLTPVSFDVMKNILHCIEEEKS